MTNRRKHNGSVTLIVIFVIALLSTLVIGMLQLNTEEIMLMQNYIYAAESRSIAEAGLNAAFAELRDDSSWTTGFADTAFASGNYSVAVSGTLPDLKLDATSTTSKGYASRVEADITVGGSSPHIIKVEELRINK
jgi:Tfp pilus assembly protein PilX